MTDGYAIRCVNCYNLILIYPPKPEYEIILIESCPMDNGLEQSFDCDCCFHKNTIYWDKRHFISKRLQ